jgi:hypothetical protein
VNVKIGHVRSLIDRVEETYLADTTAHLKMQTIFEVLSNQRRIAESRLARANLRTFG